MKFAKELRSIYVVVAVAALLRVGVQVCQGANFVDEFDVVWAPTHSTAMGNGVQLTLTNVSGSAFRSKNNFLYGSFHAKIKVVPGNAAGVVISYYLSSDTLNHDELDFEFLGNVSGQPWILQTNVFANGVGGREQRVYLWFDPTTDFHQYSIIWNFDLITFYVDSVPIRTFKNLQNSGVNYPSQQPMGMYSSIFDASDWATRGGLDKINWTQSPFIASYSNFSIDACTATPGVSLDVSSCSQVSQGDWWGSAKYQTLDLHQMNQLKWVQNNYLIYNYCTDAVRYPTPPTECSFNRP